MPEEIRDSDARAVENPITDMFKLSEDVYTLIPEMKKMILYSYFYFGSTLLILLGFILVFLVAANVFGVLILLLMFIIGILSLLLLRKLNRFIKYFSIRHSAIKAVYEEQETDIPSGADPAERIITYLSRRDPPLKKIIQQNHLKRNYTIKTGSGSYTFDLLAFKKPSLRSILFGGGDTGYSLFVKVMHAYPTLMQVLEFDAAVTKGCKSLGLVPTRAIILVSGAKNELDDATYETIFTSPIVVKHGLLMSERYLCSVQIVAEGPDGKYDFIPFIPMA
jgi:hypothetical protein